tara:strand:+ start:877 stop:1227 length:351 start_codon:yes stop_codon:yes gene_type:complete
MSMLKALLINSCVFLGLFLMHIVFAANGQDTAFTAVALLISLQVIGFGPLTVFLAGDRGVHRRRTLRRTLVVGLPLAFGLAWSYGGMAWSLTEMVAVVGASISVHFAFYRCWREED